MHELCRAAVPAVEKENVSPKSSMYWALRGGASILPATMEKASVNKSFKNQERRLNNSNHNFQYDNEVKISTECIIVITTTEKIVVINHKKRL